MMPKLIATAACGLGARRKLLILTYHRVLDDVEGIVGGISVESFGKQIEVLSRYFQVLRLDRASMLLSEHKLPPRAACITFDDGYADNFENALPILEKHNIPATFFIAAGYLDGGIMWNDIVIEACQNSGVCQNPKFA